MLASMDRAQSPTPRTWRKRVAVLTTAALLTFGLGEAGHRLLLARQGSSYDAAQFAQDVELSIDNVAAYTPEGAEVSRGRGLSRLLHPFTGSEHWHDTGGVLTYFRELAPDDDTFEVLIVGGSVAMAWSGDVQDAFTNALQEHPSLQGRRIHLLRYAHAAYKQPQQLTRVAFLFSLGYRPDAVINLDGFNEIANGLQNSKRLIHPLYPSAPVWSSVLSGRGQIDPEMMDLRIRIQRRKLDAQAVHDQAARFQLYRSSVLGHWTRNRIGTINAARREDQARYLQIETKQRQEAVLDPESDHEIRMREARGPDFDPDPDHVIQMSVDSWFESSLSLHAMCAARDIPYLHVLQPSLLDPGSKILTTKEQRLETKGGGHWIRAVRTGYPLTRTRGLELQARGVPFLDLTQVFANVQETIYVDPVHFQANGYPMLSAPIAASLRELLP